jgi:hypothetical protein
MALERLPAPERASSEIAEMIDRELAPHAACDRLCEVIVPIADMLTLPDTARYQTQI